MGNEPLAALIGALEPSQRQALIVQSLAALVQQFDDCGIGRPESLACVAGWLGVCLTDALGAAMAAQVLADQAAEIRARAVNVPEPNVAGAGRA
jgi:hypothetical protein